MTRRLMCMARAPPDSLGTPLIAASGENPGMWGETGRDRLQIQRDFRGYRRLPLSLIRGPSGFRGIWRGTGSQQISPLGMPTNPFRSNARSASGINSLSQSWAALLGRWGGPLAPAKFRIVNPARACMRSARPISLAQRNATRLLPAYPRRATESPYLVRGLSLSCHARPRLALQRRDWGRPHGSREQNA
jgi:hypothetical protein